MPATAPGTITRTIHRFTPAGQHVLPDRLAVEEPLEIAVLHRGRRRTVAITMRTPGEDRELATGFLYTEGLLPPDTDLGDGAQVQANSVVQPLPADLPFDLRGLDRNAYVSSSCGICGKTSLDQVYRALPFPELPRKSAVSVALLYGLPEQLRARQLRFSSTGGIHAAGLFDESGAVVTVREDVGRHNALDKLIGHHFLTGTLPLTDHVLVLSGRASFELIQKAAMAGLRTVISVGAPSSLAVDLADDQGITLCGFVRPGSLNAYTHPSGLRGAS